MAFAGGMAAEVAAVGPANTPKLSACALLAIEAVLRVAVFAGLMYFGLCYMGDSKYSILVSENLLYDHTFVVDPESVRVEAPFALEHRLSQSFAETFSLSNGNGEWATILFLSGGQQRHFHTTCSPYESGGLSGAQSYRQIQRGW